MRKAALILLMTAALPGCGREAPPVVPAAASSALQASFPGRDPALRRDAAGNLHVVYVEDREGGAVLSYRRLGADPAGPVAVSPPGLAVSAHGEAAPVLEVLPGGALVTAYPVALPGKWKNELRVQRSADGGATWSEAGLLHPRREGSHSYLSSALTAQGTVAFAWLDDRTGHMGLHTAASPDGVTVSAGQTLDPETCECCGTDLLAGSKGDLWLAYRALEKNNIRDIHLLKASSGTGFSPGGKLSDDGWSLDGCPHTGARLAEAADGTLWATWFTGAEPGVYAASSADGGGTFTPRTQVAAPAGELRAVTHPEVGTLRDGRIAVLYEAVQADGSHPILARLRDPATGTWQSPRPVAPQGSYPRLAGDVVAFTCRTEKGTNVVVADWAVVEKGGMGWTGCSAEAAAEHHH